MIYKKGDRVIVRPDLNTMVQYEDFNDPSVIDVATTEMCKLRGTMVTIRDAYYDRGKYEVKEDDGAFWWVDGMFLDQREEPEPFDKSPMPLEQFLLGSR